MAKKTAKRTAKKMSTMNKIMGCIAVWVEMANPNGNIEDGGPRVLTDGHGWISAMCSKRQFRELLADHSSPVFQEILAQTDIPEERLHIFESVEKGFPDLRGKEAVDAALGLSDDDKLARYIDMRLFGTTCLEERADKTKKGESTRFLRTGCIQFDELVSLVPIDVVMAGISKKAPLRDTTKSHDGDKNPELWQSDLAPEAIKVVRSGLYFGCFYISPAEAFKTQTTEKDVELFLDLVPHMFNRKATQRANVQVVFAMTATHNGVLGSFPEHLFRAACRPQLRDPESIPLILGDYVLPTLSDVKKATASLDVSKVVDLLE
ncbi:MAG: type I CRISPR-associated protein Cas7 [Promethearchaeota archaeon]|jgi:Cas7 group CRISPR-associated protein Csh2